MAHAIAHPGDDRLDAEAVTVPDGPEQRDVRGRHPQAGTAATARRWSRHVSVSCRTGIFLSLGYRQN